MRASAHTGVLQDAFLTRLWPWFGAEKNLFKFKNKYVPTFGMGIIGWGPRRDTDDGKSI